MGAEYYTTCPKCQVDAKAKHKVLLDRLAAAYGVLPLAEYKALEAEVHEAEPDDGDEAYDTLGMYYEILIRDQKIIVDFSAECRTCGFELVVKHDHPFTVPEP